MYDKIRDHVEFLFQRAPVTARAVELKEEMISSLMDRYTDLIGQGETEEAALGIAISSIGDVDELIRGLREQQAWEPANIQSERQRSALLVSAAIGLFIFSPVFLILREVLWGYPVWGAIFNVMGPLFCFLCIAIGVGLLVYNSRTKPKYVKMEETIVEDFKEWSHQKKSSGTLSKTVQSIIYTAVVPLYLILGIFFDAWHPGWILFLIAPCVGQIVKLVMLHMEER